MAKIRLICVQVDAGDACCVGGPVHVRHKTFDLDCPPEVASWLSRHDKYISTSISGTELVDDQAPV